MPQTYYAIGTTLANMVNIESTYSIIPNSLQENTIPLMAPTLRRLSSGAAVRNGKVSLPLAFSYMEKTLFNAFVYGVFGDFITASTQVYISAIDETNAYSAFLVELDRAYPAQTMQNVNSTYWQEISFPAFGWTLQSQTVTASETITTSDRLTYADTSSGTVTLTLPAAASVTANTVYSFQKTSASNTLTIDGDSSETIDGQTTQDLTALNARFDIVSDGVDSWSSVTA